MSTGNNQSASANELEAFAQDNKFEIMAKNGVTESMANKMDIQEKAFQEAKKNGTKPEEGFSF